MLVTWDFDGQGEYPEHSTVAPSPEVTARATHAFTTPGTYFPAVRVASHRDGDAKTPYALARNIARARVVVTG